jgi:hypothetical protein
MFSNFQVKVTFGPILSIEFLALKDCNPIPRTASTNMIIEVLGM